MVRPVMVRSILTVARMLPVVIHVVLAVPVAIARLIMVACATLAAVHGSRAARIPVLPPAYLVPGTHVPAARADSGPTAVTTSASLRGCEGWNHQEEGQSQKKGRYNFHCFHLKQD